MNDKPGNHQRRSYNQNDNIIIILILFPNDTHGFMLI